MRKITTFIFSALIGFCANTASADLILTAIYDGSGSTPKGVEFYVDSTGSYSGWTVDAQFNANTTWSTGYTFDGTVYNEGDFIYVTSTSEDACFNGLANVIDSGTFNMNGDDRVRVTDGTATIDQYGDTGVDGSGTAWEYVDTFATRVNSTTASGSFVIGDWDIRALNTLDPGNGPLAAAKGTFVPAAIPEPSSLALLGLVSLGLVQRRRR